MPLRKEPEGRLFGAVPLPGAGILDCMAHPAGSFSGPVIYREVQHFRQSWLWLVGLLPAILAWVAFVQQIVRGRSIGEDPLPDWGVWLVWALFGLGLPLFLGLLRMVVEVTSTKIVVSYRPLSRRAIDLREVLKVEARRYNALKEYGGWGVKGWSRDKMAYNVSGDRGVELTLRDGRSVMLGSRRAEELAQVIEQQRRAR